MGLTIKSRLLAWAISVPGAALPWPALAQQPDPLPSAAAGTAATPADPAAPAGTALPDIAGDDAIKTIVVVANRYQASKLQMRAANTVNVLSAQDLAHTAVHNVAEALGLLPGINVTNTGSGFIGGVDGASRGEGMFVSIRGLNSEYNINQINGVDVAQGNPYSRGVQLSLIPPFGLQTIVLNKTSLPDMDGDAIGGTVDFHTPSAFDYRDRLNASMTGGGRLETRARDYGRSGLGYSLAGDASAKFGAGERFGIYVSGFYDIRHYANSLVGGVAESGCCDRGTDFAVQNADGTSATGRDPARNLILTGANFGVSSGYTRRFGGNASFDWRPDDTTSLYVRGTFAQADTRQDSHLTQVVGRDKLTGSNGVALGNGTYAPIIGSVSTRFWYETNPEKATLGTLQAGVEKHLGRLTIAPNIFFSWGRNDRPDHIEVAARTLGADGNGLPYGGSSLFTYRDRYPSPTLTADQNAALNDIPGMAAAGGPPELTAQRSGQKKGGAKIDVRYDVDNGWLDYIKIGAKAQDSKRTLTNRDWTVPDYGGAATFGQLGLINGTFNNVWPGKYLQSVPDIDQSALFSLFQRLGGATDATIDTCGSNPVNSYNCNTQIAREFVAAAYAMASAHVGRLEVIPGIRFEHTEINNTFWLTPSDDAGNPLTGHFTSNSTSYNRALPSISFNLRPDNRSVYRASVWTSYVRPPFLYLGGGANTSVAINGDLVVRTITQGNPALKPITALNVDASGEWDLGRATHIALAGFYKRLHNYIYDNGSSAGVVNAVTSSATILYQPRNGGSGQVYGVEASFRQRLPMLPGLLGGLGVGGNVTRQWTRVDLLGDGTRMDRIQNAPNWLANGQLFYERGPIAFDVNYDYSGSYVQMYDTLGYGSKWDNIWVRPIGRLDLHAGYTLNRRIKLDGSVSNVLGTYSYWSHITRHSLAVSDIVNSGTTMLFTATLKL